MMANRIIALVDMDCFYAQVEQKLDPEIRGKPCAVVQYKKWKGGSIIAVNYEAREFGVTRNMYGDDAKQICPSIQLARVPEVRGKADLTRYRDASKEVFAVLTQYSDCVERASIDEAYLDLTNEVQKAFKEGSRQIKAEDLPTTHILGMEKETDEAMTKDKKRLEGVKEWLTAIYEEPMSSELDQQLVIAAEIVEKLRKAVFEQTSFHCSAGIAHNKMLAKLACGINKPRKQTIVPKSSIPELYNTLPVKKVRNLGGKLGESLKEELGCNTMADLAKLSVKDLQNHFNDKISMWLYELGRGNDSEAVTARQLAKSVGCSKNFFGKTALNTREQVRNWVHTLSSEVVERLLLDMEANKRMAKVLTVSVRLGGNVEPCHASRSCAITVYDVEKIAHDVMVLLEKLNTVSSNKEQWHPPLHCLSLSAGKFQDQISNSMANIRTFFNKDNSASSKISEESENISEQEKTKLQENSKKKDKHEGSSKMTMKSFFFPECPSSNKSNLADSSTKGDGHNDNKEPELGFFTKLMLKKSREEKMKKEKNTVEDESSMVIDEQVVGELPANLKVEVMSEEAKRVGKIALEECAKKNGIKKFLVNKSLGNESLSSIDGSSLCCHFLSLIYGGVVWETSFRSMFRQQ